VHPCGVILSTAQAHGNQVLAWAKRSKTSASPHKCYPKYKPWSFREFSCATDRILQYAVALIKAYSK